MNRRVLSGNLLMPSLPSKTNKIHTTEQSETIKSDTGLTCSARGGLFIAVKRFATFRKSAIDHENIRLYNKIQDIQAKPSVSTRLNLTQSLQNYIDNKAPFTSRSPGASTTFI